MHIPDGYLSPIFSLGTGIVTIPAWTIAVRRVQAVLNNRTVPLLAIFSAFSFTIMMFNVPVPGGTTAHGVGATLIAVVLGVPAAIIGVSLALILQALFFGDGGILAIFANCLNMAVIIPLVSYWVYRAIAARSPVLSTRRVWAAGIGAYIGMTVSALAVGIELGVQPLLFTDSNGQALYSPYGLAAAIPSMLVSHLFGASIVEALITALGVAYLQKRHPEFLTSKTLRSIVSGPEVPEGQAVRQPLWQTIGLPVVAVMALLFVAGLITGGGDLGHAFGADWSQVNWADVATMMLVIGILAVILLPVAYFVLPRRIRGIGTTFMAVAILAPLGLIAPGFAYGEGSPGDVQAAFGYVPKGLQDLSSFFSVPFAGYDVPFISGENHALWRAAIGYEISGIIGMVVLALVVWGLATLLRKRGHRDLPDIANTTSEGKRQKAEGSNSYTTRDVSGP